MTVPAVAALDYLAHIIPHQNRMSRGDFLGNVSNEAYRRYAIKTYNKYLINLRKVEDADIIARVEERKAAGQSPTEYFKRLAREDIARNGK